jgi:hypothetical protein
MVALRSHGKRSEKTQEDNSNAADQSQAKMALSAASPHSCGMNPALHYGSLASEQLKFYAENRQAT